MRFSITLKDYSKTYKINIEQFDVTERSEKFRVIARNKTIIGSPEGDSWLGKPKKRPGAIDVLQQILP